MYSLRFRRAIAGALAGLVATAALHAQSSFFFGDSLTDSGNVFAASSRTSPASPPYFNGRFSSGPTYADLLAPGLQPSLVAAPTVRTNLNFAFGGATAGVGSTVGPLVTHLAAQVSAYQARGITAGAPDRFYVFAGANDIFGAVALPANQQPNIMAGVGSTAAGHVIGSARQLGLLGARNIVLFTLPNLANTPQFRGSPAAILVQSAYEGFNASLLGGVGSVRATGASVLLIDVKEMLDILQANPATYGFSSATASFLPAATGNVNSFIFMDGVHPTGPVHAIFANVITFMQNPSVSFGTVAPIGRMALVTGDYAATAVDLAAERARATHREVGHFDVTVGSRYHDGDLDAAGGSAATSFQGPTYSLAANYRASSEINVSFVLDYGNFETELSHGAGSLRFIRQGASLSLGYNAGAFWVDGALGLARNNARDIRRATVLVTQVASGDTAALAYSGAFRLGVNLGSDAFTFSPFVGLRYLTSDFDGYTEAGAGQLGLTYDELKVDNTTLLGGVVGTFRTKAGEMPLAITGRATYGRDVGGDFTVTGTLNNNFTAPVSRAFSKQYQNAFDLGLSATLGLTEDWAATVGYGGQSRTDAGWSSVYSLALGTQF